MLVWWLFTGDSRRGKVASRNHYLLHKSQNWLQKTEFALIKGKINTGLSICSPIICHFIMNDWSTKKSQDKVFFSQIWTQWKCSRCSRLQDELRRAGWGELESRMGRAGNLRRVMLVVPIMSIPGVCESLCHCVHPGGHWVHWRL